MTTLILEWRTLNLVAVCLHTQDKLRSWNVEECGWNRKICLQSCALGHTYLLPEVAFIESKASRTEEQKASPSVNPCKTEAVCLTLSLLCSEVFVFFFFFFF